MEASILILFFIANFFLYKKKHISKTSGYLIYYFLIIIFGVEILKFEITEILFLIVILNIIPRLLIMSSIKALKKLKKDRAVDLKRMH